MSALDGPLEERRVAAIQRRILTRFLQSSYADIGTNAPVARRKIARLTERIRDLDTQIRSIDDRAIKKKRCGRSSGLGRQRVELNDALFGSADTYSFETADDAPVIGWMREAVAMLTPRQAQCIDLYFNKGYSFKKCAELLGLKAGHGISGSVHRGLKCIQYWIEIRSVVTRCAERSPFDWDRLLTELDLFPPKQLSILLTLLDSVEDEFPSARQLYGYVRVHIDGGYREIRRLKGVLYKIGVPHAEVDAIHPLMAACGAPDDRPLLIHRLCRNADLEKFAPRKKMIPDAGP